jgi:hypothetical protein
MKKGKKEEVIDLTNLPKINVTTSSLLLNFKNQERRFKLLENIFKNPDKIFRFISREQIIEFAKENKIYIDPEEGKKPNPKDPPIEKREINSEELAKAAAGVIIDRSVPLMKDKKALLEKIEELKKQKEEAIQQRDNPQPVDPKAKAKPADKKGAVPVNPDDIIIPVIDEFNTDLAIVFYNYPLNKQEYLNLEQEKVVLNHLMYVRETDEFIEEPKEEVQLDKNGKPIKAAEKKDAKPSNDIIQMQKYFALPNLEIEHIYRDLLSTKQNSDKNSLLRLTFFENFDFSFKIYEETKKDTIITFQEDYAIKMNIINRSYLTYLSWLANTIFQKFSLEKDIKKYTFSEIVKYIKESHFEYKDFEHSSTSALLFSFCIQLMNSHRLKQEAQGQNDIVYVNNDIDGIFDNLEKEILYEYGKKEINIPEENKMSMEMDFAESEGISNQASSHVQNSRLKESINVEQSMITNDDLSSPFKMIINENDLILKSSIQNKLEGVSIADKEKELQIFRKIPGVGRYLMPMVSPVEENRRKALKSEIYPFLEDSIGIPLYEKFLILQKFETILKEKVPEQNFNFGDRIYQEVMNRDILSQTITNSLLYDMECVTLYNERDDNLLLATYYRCPKGRIYRKTNKSRYLSKPDFENWVKYFRPNINMGNNTSADAQNTVSRPSAAPQGGLHNIVPEGDPKHKPISKKGTIINQKTVGMSSPIDIEQNILYDADDTCIGEVTEKIKYMFPSDNGVFIRKQISNGIFNSSSSYVRKDNLVFGIRKNNQGITEFWLRFENDVLLTCNYIGDYDPYVYGNDKECTYDTRNGVYTTLSYKNGLNVQIMADGDICQKIYNTQDTNEVMLTDNETHRIVTSKASVLKYHPLDKTVAMYANGNVCTIQNGLAVNTNNKGNRIAKRIADETMFQMDPIPITIQSDPESNTKTLIRDDKVILIQYPDDSELTIHSDDTKIYTYPDGLKYLIEHDNFATVEIEYDPVKKRTKTCLSDSDALLGCDNVMTRSYDGRLSKITLPDKTIVYSFKEKKQADDIEKYSFNTITLIQRPDGTVIRVQQDGDICVISSEERHLMNARGQNLNVFNERDVDYLFEYNGKPEERKRGSYTVNMKKSKIWTRDDEDNIFEIHADGTTKSKIKVTLDLQNSQVPIDELRPVTPNYDTADYIDDEAKFSDSPSNFFPPRLFVIQNDNTGYELLSENQVNNFKITKAKDSLHAKYYSQPIEDNFISHYWLTKYQSVSELISETHMINSIRIPKKLQKITQTPVTLRFPPHEIYLYRNLIESQEITQEFRDKISLAVQSKDQWFMKRKNEFGIFDKNNHVNELDENSKIQRRILQERQNPDLKFDYDALQNQLGDLLLEKIKFHSESILFDIEEFVEDKERKKLIEDKSFRILPIKLHVPNLDDILSYILESDPTNAGRRSTFIKRKKTSIDTKAVQEIKFVNDFHKSEWARNNLLGVSGTFIKSERRQGRRRSGGRDNLQGVDDLEENENNPLGLESVLNKLQTKSAYNKEENMNFDSKGLSPIVYLDEEKTSNGKFDMENRKSPQKKTLPSIYKIKVQKMKELKEKEKNDAENWTQSKSYKFNHDGKSSRQINPLVPKYLKTTFPEAEFNEDYIYVEKLTDKRIKTSSVSRRLYFNAPSVNDIRKSGQHNFLVEALDKKKTYEEMMERLNLMITSELCDPLNKMLKIEPINLDFGYLKTGIKYQMFFKIRNDDIMTNRVQIRKNLNNKFINIEFFIGGKRRSL